MDTDPPFEQLVKQRARGTAGVENRKVPVTTQGPTKIALRPLLFLGLKLGFVPIPFQFPIPCLISNIQ